MMGAGKTTLGRVLSERLQVPFRDSDRMLEHRLGRPIPQLFSIYGEEAFRGHETSVLRDIHREPGVLATGGGIVLRDENWGEFSRLGVTVFLDVPVERLKRRLTQSRRRRPLLEVENWEETFDALYASRIERYRRADIIFTIDGPEIDELADRLTCILESWS